MSIRNVVFFVTSVFVLLFSSFATWYEGSEIRNNPWEWDYSAIFSKLIYEEVNTEANLLAIDHFVYAAKYKPFFPILMAISILSLVTFIVSSCCKRSTTKMIMYYAGLGMVLLIFSFLISSSPTIGLTIFSWLFLTLGAGSIGMAMILWVRNAKEKTQFLSKI